MEDKDIALKANLVDWCIVRHPQIYKNTEAPQAVFAALNCGQPVALFGRAKNDPRYNPKTGDFADGHRLVTCPITKIKNGNYYTADTIYHIDEKDKNENYKKWCIENQIEEILPNEAWTAEDPGKTKLLHICENCGKQEILGSEEGFEQGWDYPPKMGAFKIVSPRTCGDCDIRTTLWWEITCNKTPIEKLSEHHKQTLQRILAEPDSILP